MMSEKTAKKPDTQKVPSAKSGQVASSGIPEKSLIIHLVNVSWIMAIPLLSISLGGNWLDKRLDTKPFLSILGLLLGSAVATLSVRSYLNKSLPSQGAKS